MPPLNNIDLRLLECLDALIREGSVTLAAERLQMSQGNMSNSLNRLRKLLRDPLLVRTARGMKLTDRALDLRDVTQELIRRMQELIGNDEDHDLSTVQRSIKIACTDATALFAMNPLLEKIRRVAPNLEIEISQTLNFRVAEALGEGIIDLAVGADIDLSEALLISHLASGRMVCAVGAGHSFASSVISLDHYCNAAHALFAVSHGVRATVEMITDQALADLGRARKVRFTSQFVTVVADAIARTDLVATMPDLMLQRFSTSSPIVGRPLPFAVPDFELSVVWHPRTKGDWVLAWLRQQLRSSFDRDEPE